MSYDDYKLATPPTGRPINNGTEDCDDCGSIIYSWERFDCKFIKFIPYKLRPEKYLRITAYRCKKCQKKKP